MTQINRFLIASTAAAVWMTAALVAGQVVEARKPGAAAAPAPRGVQKAKLEDDKEVLPAAVGKVRVDGKAEAIARKAVDPAEMVRVRNAALVNNVKLRFERQFRPLFLANLLHARNVCHLTKDQLRQLRPEANKMFEDFITRISQSNRPGLVVVRAPDMVRVGGNRQAETKTPDPAIELQKSIALVVKKFVAPDVYTAYEADLARLWKAKRAAAIDLILSILDRDLLLTTAQHDKLAEALESHWQDSWLTDIQVGFNGNTYYPDIADNLLAPILSDTQMETWRGKNKLSGIAGNGTFNLFNAPEIDVALGGDPAKKPATPAKAIRLAPAPVLNPGAAAGVTTIEVINRQPKAAEAKKNGP